MSAKLIIIALTATALLAAAPHARAGEPAQTFKPLTGEALKAAYSGAMMVGEFRKYYKSLDTNEYTEKHYENGTTDYTVGPRFLNGEWEIKGGDKLCYKYPNSEKLTRTYCFAVYEFDGCYYKYPLRNMAAGGPINWDNWSTRAAREGSGSACKPQIS